MPRCAAPGPMRSNNYCKSHLFLVMQELRGLLSPLRGVCTVGEGHYFLGVLQAGEVKWKPWAGAWLSVRTKKLEHERRLETQFCSVRKYRWGWGWGCFPLIFSLISIGGNCIQLWTLTYWFPPSIPTPTPTNKGCLIRMDAKDVWRHLKLEVVSKATEEINKHSI